MLKAIFLLIYAIVVVGCAILPTVTVGSGKYPNPTYEERQAIKAMVSEIFLPGDQREQMYRLARKVDLAQPLTENETDIYDRLQRENVSRIYFAEPARKEREERENLRKQELAAVREAEQQARRQEREKADQSRALERQQNEYLAAYERISSPEDAERFVARYSGKNDPDKLSRSAMKKGYAAGIKGAQECIDRANRMVRMQKEVGETVGVIDRSAMYQAGVALVQCKNRLARYKSDAAKISY